jgi:hypothetical protein
VLKSKEFSSNARPFKGFEIVNSSISAPNGKSELYLYEMESNWPAKNGYGMDRIMLSSIILN